LVNSGVAVLRGVIGVQVATRRKKWTQSEIATECGLTQPDISNLETGRKFIDPDSAQDVFYYLDVPRWEAVSALYRALYDFEA